MSPRAIDDSWLLLDWVTEDSHLKFDPLLGEIMKKVILGTLLAMSTLFANSVMADGWPLSVVGNWSIIGNQHIGTLSITTQAAIGNCRRITGVVYPVRR